MNLYKLDGYNPLTKTFTNPSTEVIGNLPSIPFIVLDTKPTGYSLFDEPENWAKYGTSFDYLSLRQEVYSRIESICGTDYVNWNSLATEQKSVALIWCSIRIINTKGMPFYVTECGGTDTANNYINDYLNKSYQTREERYYNAFTIFGYAYLGKSQALKLEGYIRKDFLDDIYTQRGVSYFSEDGINGLCDWILGLSSYLTTGLKPRIVSGEFTLLGGLNVDDFCNKLVAILDNGSY